MRLENTQTPKLIAEIIPREKNVKVYFEEGITIAEPYLEMLGDCYSAVTLSGRNTDSLRAGISRRMARARGCDRKSPAGSQRYRRHGGVQTGVVESAERRTLQKRLAADCRADFLTLLGSDRYTSARLSAKAVESRKERPLGI